MKRKWLILITMMLLIVGVFAMNSFASDSTYYSTTSREKVGTILNPSDSYDIAYGILYPDGGIAELQLCNYYGDIIYAYDIYPTNPVNPNHTTCYIGSYGARYVYVDPITDQIWGTAEYGLESDGWS